MIVYIETNFVLKVALVQEEQENCNSILSLAEAGIIQLLIPAFSLAEPFETLERRRRQRKQLADSLADEFKQLGRSQPYRLQTDLHQTVTRFLIESGEEDAQRLVSTRNRILAVADIIPLNKSILLAANQAQAVRGLSPQDAIVYASVIHHLEASASRPTCFLNRNSRDFAASDIEAAFRGYGCKLFFSFERGLRYIKSRIV